MEKILIYCIGAMALVLSGCASTYTSQVTTFHEWTPELKEKSYVIETLAGQENNPEYNHYAALLHEKLKAAGFIGSADNAAALVVTMEYGTLLTNMQFSTPPFGLTYDPFWRMHYSRIYRTSSLFYPYSLSRSAPFMASDLNATRYFLHQLALTITDKKSGKKLASMKVSSEQISPEMLAQMPYLIESALKNFPGKNAQTTTVELPLTKQ